MRRALGSAFSAGNWLPILSKAAPGSIAITLDDGPTPATTPAILDMLREHKATATFFLCGFRAEQYPELTAQIVAEGHAVFTHAYSHTRMDELSDEEFVDELKRTEAVLSKARPTPSPYLVRLPYGSGHRAVRVHKLLRRWRPDCRVVHWRYAMNDHLLTEGCETEEDLARNCARSVEKAFKSRWFPGSIVLMHEDPLDVPSPLGPRTATVLMGQMLDRAAQDGLKVVGVDVDRGQRFYSPYIRTVAME